MANELTIDDKHPCPRCGQRMQVADQVVKNGKLVIVHYICGNHPEPFRQNVHAFDRR